MKKAVVIGSGAGGAMIAKELQGAFEVTLLEAGRAFSPLSLNLKGLEHLRKTGLFLDERLIQPLFPHMKIRSSSDKMVLVNGKGSGGTTTIATGNALRFDESFRRIGINLDKEFEELADEIPITSSHQKHWSSLTQQLFRVCEEQGLDPQVLPKMLYADRCVRCGQCVLGCKYGAKWDSRKLIDEAVEKGARLITGCQVSNLVIQNGIVKEVHARKKGVRTSFTADLFVLAAGGFGTPIILEQSGIACTPTLFVDPVLCVAAPWKDANLNKQLPMPFAVQREGYIISPYFDQLSFFFNKQWRMPSQDIMSLMIKLADSPRGSITREGIDKSLTQEDQAGLSEATECCKGILRDMGVRNEDMFLGTLNAGHPGGMLPLSEAESETLHHEVLPSNLYVADASLFPESLGNPPILTIMALAKRIAKVSTSAIG